MRMKWVGCLGALLAVWAGGLAAREPLGQGYLGADLDFRQGKLLQRVDVSGGSYLDTKSYNLNDRWGLRGYGRLPLAWGFDLGGEAFTWANGNSLQDKLADGQGSVLLQSVDESGLDWRLDLELDSGGLWGRHWESSQHFNPDGRLWWPLLDLGYTGRSLHSAGSVRQATGGYAGTQLNSSLDQDEATWFLEAQLPIHPQVTLGGSYQRQAVGGTTLTRDLVSLLRSGGGAWEALGLGLALYWDFNHNADPASRRWFPGVGPGGQVRVDVGWSLLYQLDAGRIDHETWSVLATTPLDPHIALHFGAIVAIPRKGVLDSVANATETLRDLNETTLLLGVRYAFGGGMVMD